MKIIYLGTQKESYNPKRGMSFEYMNFYLTLKEMSGIEVVEFPFDRILEVGKVRFNEELLEMVRKEKPDLVFVFMFSDELDKKTLLEIKKITKTVAWYADDSWRFYNYSRRWYPYFTWNVTTYSWIPELAAKTGIRNVIRSQWAANPKTFYPVTDLKKDIEVSFVGQRNPERAKVIAELRDRGIVVYVRGWGWPEGKASQKEMLEIVSRSKITLNINSQRSPWNIESLGRLVAKRSMGRFIPDFHLAQNFESWRRIGVPQVKARPFELAACSAFVVSGFADDLDSFYKEGSEMVFYRGANDLAEKIDYYRKHDAERNRVASAGYARTMRDHTYEKRFRELFAMIEGETKPWKK